MWGLEKLKGVGHLQLLALKARPRAWNKVKAKPTPDGRIFVILPCSFFNLVGSQDKKYSKTLLVYFNVIYFSHR